MHPITKIAAAITLAFSSVNLCADENRLVFAAQWMPQAQFAGYYVAIDQGFYEEAGISLEIIYPSYTRKSLDYLTEGEADIASLFLVNAIKAKSQGTKLINIAQLIKKSSILFVSKKDSGIETLQDFEGKRAGVFMTGFEEIPKSLLAEHHIDVEWIPILSSVNLFLIGGLDLMTVMYYNEYNRLYLSGINWDEMNTFFMADYGYDFPEDGLYVLEHTFHERKNDLKDFVDATIKGWEFAAANKSYTIELVVELMRENNIPSNRTHMSWMLDKVLEAYGFTEDHEQLTHLEKADFDKAVEMLLNFGSITASIDYDDFYRPVWRGTK